MTPVRVPFVFVDVFAASPLTGNPVSVVPDADSLTDHQMRSIAREFNQSETVFIVSPTLDATYRLRAFTTIGAEVYGAGHHSLGTWLWLASAGRLGDGENFFQQIGDQVLPVRVTRAPLMVAQTQSAPSFGATISDPTALANALGLGVGDVIDPVPQVISTGAEHLMVAVADRAAVDQAVVNADRLAHVLAAVGAEGCYVYTVDGGDVDAYARFFNPVMGIAEDPATGTAAGPLAVRLRPDGGTVVIEQGRKLGRPSRIEVTVVGDVVSVRGGGFVVAEGTLLLS